MGEPYTERRRLLEELNLNGDHWQTPGYNVGNGHELLEVAGEKGLEGLVGKRLDSRYEPGRRGGSWIKVKNTARQELVIGGWFPGEGRRKDRIGALLVGYYDDRELRYAGKVGTGFSDKDLAGLAARLRPLERESSPFSGRQPQRGAVFVEPELVAEVEFTEWTRERLLRHPSFKGLRDDKDPREVRLERPVEAEAAPGGLPAGRALEDGGVEVTVDGRAVRLSKLDEVLFPETGFTKGDLIDYYARIAELLLPHMQGRPLTLKRRHGKEKDHSVVNDLATLIWVADLAEIELHTSLSLAESPERPTAMVLDLGPGEPAGMSDCCEVALWIRGMLAELDLEVYAKTSGSNGLQLYMPLNSEVSYERTKGFARAVAQTLERQFPDRVVSGTAKELRHGKVLVDWSRNDQHKSVVAVYSVRAGERPTVSTPLRWEEVESADPERLAFEVQAVLARAGDHGDLFAPVHSERQELPELGG
jgi:bifunctional non-homologous end joining protein LigD